MSILFWRKTTETGEYRPDGKAQTKDVAVNTEEPLPVTLVADEESPYYPVRIPEDGGYQAPIAGQRVKRKVKIPGIGTGSAYADGEAFGGVITWHNVFRADKCSGWITGVRLIDLDDEGIQVDVPFYAQPITATTDNQAFAPSDDDQMNWLGAISIDTFYNYSSNQGGQNSSQPMHIIGDGPNLYSQCVIRGAANIAAGAEPSLILFVVPD